MDANEYQKLAMKTLNPALGEKDVLINAVMGLCGEAGEVIDIVKKHLAQGHALDTEKIKKSSATSRGILPSVRTLSVFRFPIFLRGILRS